MSTIAIATIAWIALPFFVGFLIYLVPKFDRFLALGVTLLTIAYSVNIFVENSPFSLKLLDNFGVSLLVDELSGFFILTNGLVTTAVLLYCWNTNKKAFFYTQTIILHGSLNSIFICNDFISLYVALEVLSIASFLLITYTRSERSIWVGLRYLFISNTAMLFYLVGAILVYQSNNVFAFTGLRGSPPEAVALIFLGLLVKGGVFVSGLWLPLTHSESESPVSALLSGIVIKAGIFPLLRCAPILPEIDLKIRIFGVASACLGVVYAIFEKDTKRTLALSTISQLGWILSAPEVGGFYALAHGLGKASLFLSAGVLPSRNFKELQKTPINTKLWIALLLPSLSISGFPLLCGFGAKALTMNYMLPAQVMLMNVVAVGTALVCAKFIFLPFGKGEDVRAGFWSGVILLLAGLIVANVGYVQAYTVAKITKAIAIVALGWFAYFLIVRRLEFSFSRVVEQFDHLIGGMSLVLIWLFWMTFV